MHDLIGVALWNALLAVMERFFRIRVNGSPALDIQGLLWALNILDYWVYMLGGVSNQIACRHL